MVVHARKLSLAGIKPGPQSPCRGHSYPTERKPMW